MAYTVVYVNLENLQKFLDEHGEKTKLVMRVDGLLPTSAEVEGKVLIIVDK